MTPDYRRIAELEYELGFSDEKPPARVQSARTADSILKSLYGRPSDVPGAVIAYNPPRGRDEVAWVRQPLLQPPGELRDWMEADIDRKAAERS